MYHSVTFGDKNTWDDWKLIPSSRPLFNPPKQKTNTLEIAGADGALDLSEALTGYPIYNNREGSMEFLVMNDYAGYKWSDVYSEVMDYLHGKQMKAILEDDPQYYYEGRFTVNSWKSNSDYSNITIDYSVNPYKWSLYDSLDTNWLWDPFNFETDIIMASLFGNISVESDTVYTYFDIDSKYFGRAPVCPQFTISTQSGNGMDITMVNNVTGRTASGHLSDGTDQRLYDLVVYDGSVRLGFKGKGTVSIRFRKGRL